MFNLTEGWSLVFCFHVLDKFFFFSPPSANHNRLKPEWGAGANFDCVSFEVKRKKKEKKHVRTGVTWFLSDVSFQDFAFNTNTKCSWSARPTRPPARPPHFRNLRRIFQRGTWRASRVRSVKNVGYWNFFFFFFETFGGGALDVAHVLRVCGCRGKTQALRQIKLPIDTSSESHYCPPHPPDPPYHHHPAHRLSPPCKNPLGCSSHLPRRIFSLP